MADRRLTTWHSQTGLLAISATWGLSYTMPTKYRIPFSEVFPPNMSDSVLGRMWIWGVLLLVPALTALTCEQLAMRTKRWRHHPWIWWWIFASHIGLAAIYIGLAVAALFAGMSEIPGSAYPHPQFWAAVISAISRPVLWGYIGFLHTTFARLPRPEGEPDDDDASTGSP